jgi:FMN phosphatase YigB (HAD superfamily)
LKSIASFDVFDTVLTRKVASPTSLFLIVGERAARAGWIHVPPAAFRDARVHAENEARAGAPACEVNFDEIYRHLATSLDLPSGAAEAVARLELEAEAELLVPVPGAFELVASARVTSPRVLFVSDMYLPAEFIRAQLQSHGFWRQGDRVFVSCEWRASKAEGSLFRRICEAEKVEPAAIEHTGDRHDADFTTPAGLGITARHREPCRLTYHEQALERAAGESAGTASLLAGASRLARLKGQAPTEHLATLSDIACSLISPTITLYVLWLLKQAQQRGYRRLYFVARDGYLVKRIAVALIVALDLPIEARYLYGSRQAWHLPAITEFTPESLSWLFDRTRTLTLRIVIGRLQMTPEQIDGILIPLGWPRATWDQPMDGEALARLQADLLSSSEFRSTVEALVTSKRQSVLGYLEQEGLFDDVPWAMVDLGWHGRLQQSLEKLLNTRQPVKTSGLYFALYASSPAVSTLDTTAYFDWDLANPPTSQQIPSLIFLMESFCTAPHGSTVGYGIRDGKMVPVYRQEGVEELEEWGVAAVHAAVERFARELETLPLSDAALTWNSREMMVRLLWTFSQDPLAAEARAWGSFPYEDEQAGTAQERLTRGYELTLENLRLALTFGDHHYLPQSRKILWHGGQLHTLSAGNTVIKIALRLGRLKHKVGNRLRGLRGRVTSESTKALPE